MSFSIDNAPMSPIIAHDRPAAGPIGVNMATWLTLDEMARYLKKGRSTLYRMARSGQLPSQKVGRTWRFDQEEVDRWIKDKQAGSSHATARRARHD